MSRKSTSTYLQDLVELLVDHFGVGPVRSALARVSNGAVEKSESPSRPRAGRAPHGAPSVATLLEDLQLTDPEKFRLLSDFFSRLKSKTVLPDAHDIRHFSQLIGFKEIDGKSRNDMMAKLMRVLIERPNERLRHDIESAASVSEQQRKQGFSVLTDKILSGTD